MLLSLRLMSEREGLKTAETSPSRLDSLFLTERDR